MHTHKDTGASVNLRGRGSIPVILQPTCLPYRHAADTATRLPARLGLIKHGTAQGSNGMTHTCRQTHGYTVLQTCANPSSLKFLIKYLPKIWPQKEKLFLASSIIINRLTVHATFYNVDFAPCFGFSLLNFLAVFDSSGFIGLMLSYRT